ncbi:M15 family metallopeptidase [Nocardia rhizosphaerihabitans]|uniref:D-alanyl-D-alanine carboxypeptidase-like core domain-containing protein n=1 Tax=Nocardia rhizosphaerihabitans TaxID=1691570 RepID=A0ABQ2KIE4_9NOCA|nr:M15 family metallopeptidase [Nocardia rhizosphaerihabitans]GGN82830.1 hypothetical protein GCM10011610_34650 [Nocardia rhizosphaerihabitans]
MNPSGPAPTVTPRFRPIIFTALVLVGAAAAGVLVYQSQDFSAARSIGLPVGDRPPPGATVFDDEDASVANLDPDLLDALRRAATDAADDGIRFVVNSGWRSARYQEQLLREAVSKYGSRAEAARWVATPDTSAHVSGDAVDIGPIDAAAWLAEHGAGYGLCQVYINEPWHYELRADAGEYGCPPRYADPTEDPRMQQ